MWISERKEIPPKEWYHNPELTNSDNQTVAMLLVSRYIIPPKEWCYDPLKNFDEYTLQDFLLNYNMIPPIYLINMASSKNDYIKKLKNNQKPIPSYQQETNPSIFDQAMLRQVPDVKNHKIKDQNEDGWTVAMIFAFQGLIPPKEWMYISDISNKYNHDLSYYMSQSQHPILQHIKEKTMTIFDQAIMRQIPNILGHQPDEQDEDGFTVSMILAINNIEIPSEWEHDPNIRNNYGYTVALYQARNGKIPDIQWRHNKFIRGQYFISHQDQILSFLTVQDFLEDCVELNVPEYWKYQLQDSAENNNAILEAQKGYIPQLQDYDPNYQNMLGQSVALSLAKKGILPPREWMHDVKLIDEQQQSIESYFQKQRRPVPRHWNDEDMTIFDIAIYGQVPQLGDHNPNDQDEDGWTVAMILAYNDIEIPEQWYHKPYLQNCNNDTVYDICYQQGIIPPEHFCINSSIQDENRNTFAMILAQNNKIVPKYLYHGPDIMNLSGQTVAYLMSINNIIPPKEWVGDTNIQYGEYKLTIAMILFDRNLQIPEYCYHKPEIRDSNGITMGLRYAFKGLIPPKQWMHNVTMQDSNGQSILSILQGHEYIYKNKEFILNYKTYFQEQQCQICLKNELQEFILSNCKHNVCLQCFKQLINKKEQSKCPICKQYNWYLKVVQ